MPGEMDRKSSALRSRDISGAVRTIIYTFIFVMVTTGPSSAQQAIVKVKVPGNVSGAFDIVINIDNALDLDSGQFDIYFDPYAIRVRDVKDGAIGGILIPIDIWTILNPGRIRAIFNLPGVKAISGNGYLAKINAEPIGKTGGTTNLTLHKGLLVNKDAKRTPAQWINGKVKIEGIVSKVEPVAATQSEQACGPDTESSGITISTPMALAGLAILAAIPGLFLILFRKGQKITQLPSE